jgi:hypothetical protein
MAFEFPAPGFHAVHMLVIVISFGGFVTAAGMAFFVKANFAGSGGGILTGIILVLGFFPVLFSFTLSHKLARTRETLTLTSEGDVILERSYVLSRSTTIPANELEELFVRHPERQPLIGMSMSKVFARSDKESLEFGVGSPAAELDWIVAVIEYRVVRTV